MSEVVAYAGPQFTIEWFFHSNGKSEVLDFFSSLSENQQDSLLYLLKRMGDTGRINDTTKFNNEGDGIYAFKPQPERFLCFFQKGRKIILTNAFTKKQNKLPPKEKQKARERQKDYLARVNQGTYYEKEN